MLIIIYIYRIQTTFFFKIIGFQNHGESVFFSIHFTTVFDNIFHVCANFCFIIIKMDFHFQIPVMECVLRVHKHVFSENVRLI
jgi:hypothetical protein